MADMSVYLQQMAVEQKRINDSLRAMSPEIELSIVPQGSRVLVQGASATRFYFENRGARVISRKTIIQWDLDGTGLVLVGLNKDAVLYNTVIPSGVGILLNANPFFSGLGSGFAMMEFAAPIEFVSIVRADTGGGNISVNPIAVNSGTDRGYISIQGWGIQEEAFVPQGNR